MRDDAAERATVPSDDPQGPTVWLVEDSPTDAEEYTRFLERSGKLKITSSPIFETVDEYRNLANNPAVGAVIVDKLLGEHAGVSYGGLDIATFLRTFDPALPVFILTNYPGADLDAEGDAVDLVIEKHQVRDYADTYVARILRRMGQYHESLNARQARLRELIDLKLDGRLNEAESEELATLRREIERPGAEVIDQFQDEQQESLSRDREFLAELSSVVEELRRVNRGGGAT
jgi:hypothetical protein